MEPELGVKRQAQHSVTLNIQTHQNRVWFQSLSPRLGQHDPPGFTI